MATLCHEIQQNPVVAVLSVAYTLRGGRTVLGGVRSGDRHAPKPGPISLRCDPRVLMPTTTRGTSRRHEPISSNRKHTAYGYDGDLRALVAGVVLVLVMFALHRCTDASSRDGVTVAETAGLGTASKAPASPSTQAPPGNPGSDWILTAGGTSLLPLNEAEAAGGSLAEYVGQPAVGGGVPVWSVPADEGFWVGISDADRVWVQLIGSGESPYAVRAGDTVHFTGVVVAHGVDFPSRVCVGTNHGADLLAAQGAHIEVPMDELILHK